MSSIQTSIFSYNHNASDDPNRVMPLTQQEHDVNVRDYKGKKALYRASKAGFLKITQLLIENGSNLEARSYEGETHLFDGAFYGRTELIKLLVTSGADIEAKNHQEVDRGTTVWRCVNSSHGEGCFRSGANLSKLLALLILQSRIRKKATLGLERLTEAFRS